MIFEQKRGPIEYFNLIYIITTTKVTLGNNIIVS